MCIRRAICVLLMLVPEARASGFVYIPGTDPGLIVGGVAGRRMPEIFGWATPTFT